MKLGRQQTVAMQLMIMLGRQTRIGEHRQIYISSADAPGETVNVTLANETMVHRSDEGESI
jgi:hypothetical protein